MSEAATTWMIEQAVDRWRIPGHLPVAGVTGPVLLAWAILVETALDDADIGACRECEGDGTVETGVEHFGMHERITCRECDGVGREIINSARLLLGLATGFDRGRDALLVKADELQAAGDPRGELIALALGPWMGPPTDPVTLMFKATTARRAREDASRHLLAASLVFGRHVDAKIDVRSPSGQGAWTTEPEEHIAVATLTELGRVPARREQDVAVDFSRMTLTPG